MKLAKSPAWLVGLFDALQPEVGGERKQMFGYPCAFESGHLFTGLFADSLFVRLAETDRARLLKMKGATPFEPMKGRPMREYAVLPPSMLEDEEAVKAWMQLALVNARTLPPKKAKRASAAKRESAKVWSKSRTSRVHSNR
jgi:TfoX/Sxy family transcriptional regulator of competence genes